MKNIWLLILMVGLFLTACGSADVVELPTGTPITLPTTAVTEITPTIAATKTAVSTIEPAEPAGILPMPPIDDDTESEREPIPLDQLVAADEPVIVYSKSGGFAGLEQEWRIYADGRIENEDGKLVGQAEPAEVTAVVMLADEAGFYELDDEYLDKNITCCDLITYTLTVTDGKQSQTVVTRDMSPRPPAFVIVNTAVEDLIYDNAITE